MNKNKIKKQATQSVKVAGYEMESTAATTTTKKKERRRAAYFIVMKDLQTLGKVLATDAFRLVA